jgi:hypothetical protein
MEENDKRAATRLRIPLEGTATLCSGESNLSPSKNQLEVTANNISALGGYFFTSNCPEVGATLEFRLRDSSDSKKTKTAFEVSGTVIRVEELEQGAYGFAVQFKNAPDMV